MGENNMSESQHLQEIAQIFKKHKKDVFAVGGYVRNKILNIENPKDDDVDICSAVVPEELKNLFKKTVYVVKDKSKGLGVCTIECDGFRCEHATFRKEKYKIPGEHTPSVIEFTDDLFEDCKRRDFTINCIYMNLNTGDIVDPFGGIKDLKNKIIKTIMTPAYVFNNDGIRLMRLIRFASVLGFDIDEETMNSAQRNNFRLGLVSKSLIKKEFDKMLVADTFYPMLPKTKSAHLRAMTLLGTLDLWQYVLPIISILKNTAIQTFRKPETVYEHSLRAMFYAPPKLRLAALVHDIGMLHPKMRSKSEKNMAKYSAELLERAMEYSGLGYAEDFVSRTAKIIELTGYDMDKKVKSKALRALILEYRPIIEDVINLKIATIKAITHQLDLSETGCSLQKEFAKMVECGIPTKVPELAISGDYLIEAFPYLPRRQIASTLNTLLNYVVFKNYANTEEVLMKLCKKLIKE